MALSPGLAPRPWPRVPPQRRRSSVRRPTQPERRRSKMWRPGPTKMKKMRTPSASTRSSALPKSPKKRKTNCSGSPQRPSSCRRLRPRWSAQRPGIEMSRSAKPSSRVHWHYCWQWNAPLDAVVASVLAGFEIVVLPVSGRVGGRGWHPASADWSARPRSRETGATNGGGATTGTTIAGLASSFVALAGVEVPGVGTGVVAVPVAAEWLSPALPAWPGKSIRSVDWLAGASSFSVWPATVEDWDVLIRRRRVARARGSTAPSRNQTGCPPWSSSATRRRIRPSTRRSTTRAGVAKDAGGSGAEVRDVKSLRNGSTDDGSY